MGVQVGSSHMLPRDVNHRSQQNNPPQERIIYNRPQGEKMYIAFPARN